MSWSCYFLCTDRISKRPDDKIWWCSRTKGLFAQDFPSVTVAWHVVLSSRSHSTILSQTMTRQSLGNFKRTLDNFGCFKWLWNSGIVKNTNQLQLWIFFKEIYRRILILSRFSSGAPNENVFENHSIVERSLVFKR